MMTFFRLCFLFNILLLAFPVLAMEEGLPDGLRNRKNPGLVEHVESDLHPFSKLPPDLIERAISYLSVYDTASLYATSQYFFDTIQSLRAENRVALPAHFLAPEKESPEESPLPQNSSSARFRRQACGVLFPLGSAYTLGATYGGCCCCVIMTPCTWYAVGRFYDYWMSPKSKFADNKVFTSLEDDRLFWNKQLPHLVSGKVIKSIFSEVKKQTEGVDASATYRARLVLGKERKDIYNVTCFLLGDYEAIHDRALFESYVVRSNGNEGILSFVGYPWQNHLDLYLTYQLEY
jgi:hypothetical protein